MSLYRLRLILLAKHMNKIIVIGCPGSGKSTFSKRLHKITKIPLYHLDMLYWNADKTIVEQSVFRDKLSKIITQDAWIIDGNYASTMELRLSACDTVFFLDYPITMCLNGIEERRGKLRSDLPWIESETDAEFIEFIKNFDRNQRPLITSLLDKAKNKNIYVFSSREETDSFLIELKQTFENM